MPESSVAMWNTGDDFLSEGNWLTTLPAALRSDLSTMMIVGLGGGGSAERVPPSVREIDIVELSPAVIDANRQIGSVRARNPLSDPRVRLIVNDARNALTLTDRRYDCIVSQPSHPWTAGASHLYTLQFAELAAEHLEPGGIFLQWMSYEFIDPSLLRSMCATMRAPFPYVRIYEPFEGLLLFVASDQPIVPEASETLAVAEQDRDLLARFGMDSPTNMLALLAADDQATEKLASDAETILDEKNLMAMHAPACLVQSAKEAVAETLENVHPTTRSREELLELCPTLNFTDYLTRICVLEHSKNAEKHYQRLLTNAADQQWIRSHITMCQKDRQEWVRELRQYADTEHPYLAFEILHADALKELEPPINQSDRKRLRSMLSPSQLATVDVIAATMKNDLEPSRKADGLMASIPVHDPAFRAGLKMRIPWRLESESIQDKLDIIQMIDKHRAVVSGKEIGFFRAYAGIRARQPIIAVATANTMAYRAEHSLKQSENPPGLALFKNLQRVNLLIRQDVLVEGVPREALRETRIFVNRVLEDVLSAREEAGLPVPILQSL